MAKILVPCDGSDSALRAVRHAAALAKAIPATHIELLNVQDPMSLEPPSAYSEAEACNLCAQEAERILQPAKALLDQAGIPYRTQIRVGSPANEIAEHTRESACDAVIMGTRGMSPLGALMVGSVALKVVHLVNVPVTLVK